MLALGGLGKSEIYLRAIDAARIGAVLIDAARIDAARIDAARIDAARGNTNYNSPGVKEGSSKLFLTKRIV